MGARDAQHREVAVAVTNGVSPESRCGACGYIVKAATGFICPECGGDLRVVGIATSKPRRRWKLPRLGPIAARMLLLTAVCLAAWWVLAYPCDWYLWPDSGTSTHTVTLYPASGKYQRIVLTEQRRMHRSGAAETIYDRWTGDEGPARCLSINITAEIRTPDRPPLVMEIEGKQGMAWRFSAPGNGSVSGMPLDMDAVLEWMEAAGVDASDPQVRQEAQEVATVVTTSATSPYTFGGIGATWTRQEPFGRLEWVLYQHQNELNDFSGRSFAPPHPFPRHAGTAAASQARDLPLWAVSALPAAVLWAGGASLVLLPRRRRMKSGSRTLTLLFSDVKDFTERTAGSSREAVIDVIRRHRAFAEGPTRRHHGKIVKSIGDAVLAVFDSATNAVLAAIEIQGAARAHNETSAPAERLELRIALSTGEVTVHADDVYGSPVNIASRLQSHAPVGHVYFTEATRQALNEAEVRCEQVGPMELKGIPAPVLVYRAINP